MIILRIREPTLFPDGVSESKDAADQSQPPHADGADIPACGVGGASLSYTREPWTPHYDQGCPIT
jgi:hypothetical protein